jgi:hypothetical protein
MQDLKDTLNQAETKSKSLESQVDNLQKYDCETSEKCIP